MENRKLAVMLMLGGTLISYGLHEYLGASILLAVIGFVMAKDSPL